MNEHHTTTPNHETQKNIITAALTCVSLFSSVASSQAAVLWTENFNSYADGGFTHQGASGGFGGSWYATTGTSISGGVVTGSGNIRRDLGATFAATVGATGTIWVSFDWGHVSSHTGTFGGLTFFEDDDSTERVLIGNTFDPANWNMNGAPSTTGVSSIGMKTGVARITLNVGAANDVIDLWVAAAGSPVDVSGAPMATTSDRTLENIKRIRIMGGNDQTFDNLVFGTTMLDVDAIPEPSTALLGGLGLLALLRRRR